MQKDCQLHGQFESAASYMIETAFAGSMHGLQQH